MHERTTTIATKFTPAFACDVSYYQRPVDSRYPRLWLIYRACDGTFRDPNFDANRKWAVAATQRKVSKLRGHIVYAVYRPGVDVFSVLKSMIGVPDRRMVVMIDVESWGGRITGDHSAEISALANKLADWLGNQKRVLVYGNVGDLTSIYQHRLAWLRCIVAAYSSHQPSFPNMIGWQYTDGQTKWPVPGGYDRSTPPFGYCDHNVFPFHTYDTLADALGVADAPSKPAPAPAPKPAPAPAPAPKPAVDADQIAFNKRMDAWLQTTSAREQLHAVAAGRAYLDQHDSPQRVVLLVKEALDATTVKDGKLVCSLPPFVEAKN